MRQEEQCVGNRCVGASVENENTPLGPLSRGEGEEQCVSNRCVGASVGREETTPVPPFPRGTAEGASAGEAGGVQVYDGSFDGLLTLAARARAAGRVPEGVAREDAWQPGLLDAGERVATDSAAAQALGAELRDAVSRGAFRNVAYCWLAERMDGSVGSVGSDGSDSLDRRTIEYILLAFERGAGVDGFHAHAAVHAVHRAAGAVGGEIHRLAGLARFRELADGTLFAPIRPDHNVVCPLALHFRKRLPAERWVICDVRRGTGLHWNGTSFDTVEAGGAAAALFRDFDKEPGIFSADEPQYQAMWQTYFSTIAIRDRINPRLQRQYMPRRYWRELVEMPGRHF